MRQSNSFYQQKIPEFSSTRKEIVDIDILIVSGNGEKISEKREEFPREEGNGTNIANSDEHIPDQYP